MEKDGGDDDGNRTEPENPRTPDSSREGTPDWKETCIGVWSRSTKGRQVTEAEPDKICNGISFVVINKHTDLRKVKLSKTRGLQIVVRETEITVPPPKAHDHTHIRIERDEDDKLQKNDEDSGNSAEEQEPSLTRRVMDVMMMKKTNLEKNVEHYKAEGVKLTGICMKQQCSQFREFEGV
ncbi:uncharacterized protein LOC110063762 [Orbicella faveolata]|uniref:uncharacterized protein LOC110063762 n=1 Tax=Orbicella faveolata TaxID=48498 RepID=UPI0009E5EDE1|nr:uncharacterized protein LOC110063762 [Orbicella faveolata]